MAVGYRSRPELREKLRRAGYGIKDLAAEVGEIPSVVSSRLNGWAPLEGRLEWRYVSAVGALVARRGQADGSAQ